MLSRNRSMTFTTSSVSSSVGIVRILAIVRYCRVCVNVRMYVASGTTRNSVTILGKRRMGRRAHKNGVLAGRPGNDGVVWSGTDRDGEDRKGPVRLGLGGHGMDGLGSARYEGGILWHSRRGVYSATVRFHRGLPASTAFR